MSTQDDLHRPTPSLDEVGGMSFPVGFDLRACAKAWRFAVGLLYLDNPRCILCGWKWEVVDRCSEDFAHCVGCRKVFEEAMI